MSNTNTERRNERRTDREYAGRPGPVGTVVGERPDLVTVRRRRAAGGPAYLRVGKGDLLVEGDRPERGSGLDAWRVTAVTPDLVAGRHVAIGRSVAWERAAVERALATGGLSTTLGRFERILAISIAGEDRPGDPPGQTDRIRVVAFGDDGQRYVRTYERDPGGGDWARLVHEDAASAGLDGDLRARLDADVATTFADLGIGIRA